MEINHNKSLLKTEKSESNTGWNWMRVGSIDHNPEFNQVQ